MEEDMRKIGNGEGGREKFMFFFYRSSLFLNFNYYVMVVDEELYGDCFMESEMYFGGIMLNGIVYENIIRILVVKYGFIIFFCIYRN